MTGKHSSIGVAAGLAVLLVNVLVFASSCGGDSTQPNPVGSPTVSVAPGTLIEVDRGPGELVGLMTITPVSSVAFTVNVPLVDFPVNGGMVTVVPPIPLSGLVSVTMTVQRNGTTVRSVSIVQSSSPPSPGSATLDFLQSLDTTVAALQAPSDPSVAALNAVTVARVHQLISDLTPLVVQAQTGAAVVGTVGGQPLTLTTDGLVALDAVIAGASGAVVLITASSANHQSSALNGGLVGLAVLALVATTPAVATLAAVSFFTIGTVSIVQTVIARAALNAVETSGQSPDASPIQDADPYVEPTSQNWISKAVSALQSGPLSTDVKGVADDTQNVEMHSAQIACTDPGETQCHDSGCVIVAEDAHNCGACGTTCPAGQYCCLGSCVDPTSDNGNCGGCGVQCSDGSACAVDPMLSFTGACQSMTTVDSLGGADMGPEDPCGVVGTWSTHCGAVGVCGTCTTPTSGDYSFSISPEMAANGGTTTTSFKLTFDVGSCTAVLTSTDQTYCGGPDTWVLRDGKGQGTAGSACKSNGCIPCSPVDCSPTRQ